LCKGRQDGQSDAAASDETKFRKKHTFFDLLKAAGAPQYWIDGRGLIWNTDKVNE
jgi:hypothetical protein